MNSILDRVESGLKDAGGKLIGQVAQSAEDKVDAKLNSMTDTLNKDAEQLMVEFLQLSCYLKIAIILFSILMIILMLKSCCEGVVLIVGMCRPPSSNDSSSRPERELLFK